ncbi:MAG: hypothetical protein ABI597_09170 [Gammaproteobacteria bacterium]
MKYFKTSALSKVEQIKNQQIAAQYTKWIIAKIQERLKIKDEDERSFDLLISFPNALSKFLQSIANKNNLLLENLFGETEDSFYESTTSNSFVKKLAYSFLDMVKRHKTELTAVEMEQQAQGLAEMLAELRVLENPPVAETKEDISRQALDQIEQCLPQVLAKKGFISTSKMGYIADIQFSLDQYKGAHDNAHIVGEIGYFYDDKSMQPLQDKIKSLIDTESSGFKLLLGIAHNGGGHYVSYEIRIDAARKSIGFRIFDSKDPNKFAKDSKHKSQNANVLANIKAAVAVSIVDSLYGIEKLGNAVIYTGEQGDDANCPSYAMRKVIRQCQIVAPAQFDDKSEFSKAVHETDINHFKLATVKIGIKKLPQFKIDAESVKMDELGIIYCDPTHPGYRQHRVNRLSFVKEQQESKRDNTGARNLFDSEFKSNGVENTIATFMLVETEQKRLKEKLEDVSDFRSRYLSYDYQKAAREIFADAGEVTASWRKLKEQSNQLDSEQVEQLNKLFNNVNQLLNDNVVQLVALSQSAVKAAKEDSIAVSSDDDENSCTGTPVFSSRAAETNYHQHKLTLFGKSTAMLSVGNEKTKPTDKKIMRQLAQDEAYATILQNQFLIEHYQAQRVERSSVLNMF